MQDFIGKVTKKEYITDDVIILSMTRPADFEFKAGQFVTIKMQKDDIKRMKSYSILSNPSKKDELNFCIKIIPDGFASGIFEKTEVGNEFPVKGPFGHFTFKEDADVEEHFLIGTGTGLAPIYSMVKEYAKKMPHKKFTILVGYRYIRNVTFDEELRKMEEECPNFTYKVSITREPWDRLNGRVYEHLPKDVSNKKFYICGLKEMVIDTRDKLYAAGVSKENVVFERYS